MDGSICIKVIWNLEIWMDGSICIICSFVLLIGLVPFIFAGKCHTTNYTGC
jgi:hypothetical protein